MRATGLVDESLPPEGTPRDDREEIFRTRVGRIALILYPDEDEVRQMLLKLHGIAAVQRRVTHRAAEGWWEAYQQEREEALCAHGEKIHGAILVMEHLRDILLDPSDFPR